MKAILIALVIVAGVFSQELNQEAMQSLWSSWKQTHNKEYEDSSVENLRFQIFQANFKRINAWNAAGNTAKLAVNKFADLTNAEFGALYATTHPAPQDVVEAGVEIISGDIPTSVDWRDKGAVTPVKNQGQCGSCWAFSTVAATEGLYQINGNSLTSFSEQQIVDCDTVDFGCNGGWPYKAFAYVASNGLETEAKYPYTAVTGKCVFNSSLAVQTGVSGASFVAPKNVTALKAAIAQQPISVIVEADQDSFQFYSSGVLTTGCGVSLDHAITAVGYGTYEGTTQESFYVKNSWGSDWGVDGYIYISTSNTYNKGLGSCGILSQPQYPKGFNGQAEESDIEF